MSYLIRWISIFSQVHVSAPWFVAVGSLGVWRSPCWFFEFFLPKLSIHFPDDQRWLIIFLVLIELNGSVFVGAILFLSFLILLYSGMENKQICQLQKRMSRRILSFYAWKSLGLQIHFEAWRCCKFPLLLVSWRHPRTFGLGYANFFLVLPEVAYGKGIRRCNFYFWMSMLFRYVVTK